jgi:hypothetical protein
MKIKKIELNTNQQKTSSKMMLNSWVESSLNAQEDQKSLDKDKRYFEIQSNLEFKMIRQLKDKSK